MILYNTPMQTQAKINHIRKSRLDDIDRILEIIEIGKQTQIANDNLHQWCDEPPVKGKIEEDIRLGRSYVLDDGNIYGTFMFDNKPDPSYANIEDGNWLNDEAYGVIHRIASDTTHKGVLHAAIEYVKQTCSNVRMDTHPDNTIMKHLLIKEGFVPVGIVYINGTLRREAYHLRPRLAK